MTVETLREKGWIVYECIAGSHAYGTNIEGSDIDRRGVFIIPTDELLAGRYIEQVNDKTNDVTFYEIGRFLSLLCGGNPNILDILGTPEDCIIYESEKWKEYFPKHLRHQYLTKKLKNSFVGYAHTQIKKAKGLKKKINWDHKKVVRKDILDFCYILNGPGSRPIKKVFSSELLNTAGVTKVNNAKGVYCLHVDPWGEFNFRGVVKENSNQIRLSSIPKEFIERHHSVDEPITAITNFHYNEDGYSSHCKDYREYTEWLEKRNPQRYADNLKGEQGYDHKNMMHCMRLLMTAKDIAKKKELVIRRPEREYLLSIRNGEMKYDELLENADNLVDEIAEAFENSQLSDSISKEFQQNLLLKIRKNG